VSTIGFGVVPGHAALLRTVDHAFILHREQEVASRELASQAPAAVPVATPGPSGWAETVTRLLSRGLITTPSLRSARN
jgi:predicted mannosyl-3-phosphoglycerate phosphatase (HAD superfamily)